MRWSENDTVQFAKIYLSHECLWNPDDEHYKQRYRRAHAYKDIQSNFQSYSGILLDPDEVKVKIKSLRSTYSQEITKILNRSSLGFKHKPSLRWFNIWHKHFKDLPCSRLTDDVEETKDVSVEKAELKGEWMPPDSHSENFDDDPINPQENGHSQQYFHQENDNSIFIVKNEEQNPEPIKQELTSHKLKKKRLKKQHSKIDQSLTNNTVKTIVSSHHSVSSNSGKDDEFDIYGKYIASQLRNMELSKALKVQLAIQSLISEARITE